MGKDGNPPLVTDYKYLGTKIDAALSSSPHIIDAKKRITLQIIKMQVLLKRRNIKFNYNAFFIWGIPQIILTIALINDDLKKETKALDVLVKYGLKSFLSGSPGGWKTLSTKLIEEILWFNINDLIDWGREIGKKVTETTEELSI